MSTTSENLIVSAVVSGTMYVGSILSGSSVPASLSIRHEPWRQYGNVHYKPSCVYSVRVADDDQLGRLVLGSLVGHVGCAALWHLLSGW